MFGLEYTCELDVLRDWDSSKDDTDWRVLTRRGWTYVIHWIQLPVPMGKRWRQVCVKGRGWGHGKSSHRRIWTFTVGGGAQKRVQCQLKWLTCHQDCTIRLKGQFLGVKDWSIFSSQCGAKFLRFYEVWGGVATNKGIACPKMGTGGPNMVLPLSTMSLVRWRDSSNRWVGINTAEC